ncbi:MAG: hypothetical protein SGPRY_002838, partial [Prymnesium sp.]
MLASLALQFSSLQQGEEGEVVDEGQAVAQAKAMLLRLATPLAVFHSAELRALPGSEDYFTHHSSLAATGERYFTEPSERRLWLLLTQSAIPHCEQAIRREEERLQGRCRVRFSSMQLGSFGSEDALFVAVERFLSGSEEGSGEEEKSEGCSHALLLQHDPASSSPGLLEHAMHVVGRLSPSHSCGRHVIILVHLPPGTSRAHRTLQLDFSRRWGFLFVDDLRPQEKWGGGVG